MEWKDGCVKIYGHRSTLATQNLPVSAKNGTFVGENRKKLADKDYGV